MLSSVCLGGESMRYPVVPMEVFPHHPFGTLAWMAFLRPSPEHMPNFLVDCIEACLGYHMSMIGGPSSDYRIDQPDQRFLRYAGVLFDDCPDLVKK